MVQLPFTQSFQLPAFEAAVRTAKVGAVMDAYNKLNGAYCTENEHLNEEVLSSDSVMNGEGYVYLNQASEQ